MTRGFLEAFVELGGTSLLTVIKDCGAEGKGVLSFPKPGIPVALDLPIRDDTPRLVARLDELTIAAGGRVYLAKDAFTSREAFESMEPRLQEWRRIRGLWDPDGRLRSAQSARLLGDLV